MVLVGWLTTLSLHAGVAVALSQRLPQQMAVDKPVVSLTSTQPLTFNSSQPQPLPSTLTNLVQQGKALYQAGQFAEAVAMWQRAETTFEAQGDRLNQASVLGWIANALEQLGQWPQANTAVTQALALLRSSPLDNQPDALPILAQTLNTQGRLQLRQGQESEALTTWQQAEATYRRAQDDEGIIGSQMNQARALQALGFYRRAAILLEQVEQTLQNQPDSSLKIAGLRNLGNVLRLVGNLNQARAVLQQGLAVAERLHQAAPVSSVESALDLSRIRLSLGTLTQSQGETDTALGFYRQATAIAPVPASKIQAEVAQLSLLTETGRRAEAQAVWAQIQPQLAELPASRAGIYAEIQLAQALMKFANGGSSGSGSRSQLATPQTAAQLLATAIQQARNLGDRRAESYALGSLGNLYEQTQQWQNAQELTQQSLSLAQAINAPDIAYQWQWQLGRLLKAQTALTPSRAGDSKPNASNDSIPLQKHEAAVAAYAEAVNTLQSLRTDLVATNSEVQFSFRESVEPVYRQFVELLLQDPQGGEPDQQKLRQAREVIESLQLAELDNFFRESCLNARPVLVDQVNPKAAVVYPIILPNRLAVILSLPNQPLTYYEAPLPQAELERVLDQMLRSLAPNSFLEERLPLAQQVYDWLLRPAEAKLASSDVTTLVFVLDGALQNLPMAALHDGQQYLIEKYSVVLTPGLQLLQPQPLKPQQLRGLLAGVSQARQGFSALPNVTAEINEIRAELPAQVLLDQTFTSAALESRVDSAPFPIVHLATHGQFSSNAEETFILTWDGRINVKQLDQLLRSREQAELNPIELLVLSACQTAAGDKRATLGMAGVAVRSGARSTLATLWSVNDRSTSALMVEFYRELGKLSVNKAEALRRAQLTLLKQDEYAHPYYWAPFILLGNWL
ncbi:CHAT domain-containing protein [Leptolyngbya sp. FACHB-261]|nr:CHAT domain-containing protein [Leptolyngbya sp. FACHB-261]